MRGSWFLLCRSLVAAGGLVLVGGCAAYGPAPATPAASLVRRDEAVIDREAVRARVLALAPDATRPASGWDRLDYLVAATLTNPAIAAQRAALETAAARARAAHAPPSGPTLTLTGEYARDAAASSPWLIGGAVDIPLDQGGRRAARLALADLATLGARYDLAETVWQTRQTVRGALVSTLIARRQRTLLGQLADLRARQVAAMERRLAASEIARTEAERIRSEGANVARRQRDAEGAAQQADQSLAAAIGVRAEALAGIDPVWPDFDAPPDPAAAANAEARRQAILSRADVLHALADYQSAEATLRGELARQYPQISVSPGYTWERGLVKLPISLGLVLPPLDDNRRAIAAAVAARSEAGRRLDLAVSAAAAAVDGAIAEARAARLALAEVRTRERPLAERLAATAARALAAGTIDRTDWASAQAGAVEAALAELDALSRVHAADAALENALRRPVAGPELAIRQTPDDLVSGERPK
jgi:outer membrane protein TolC